MIAPRVRDVYILDMTSSAQESCFFAKASENLNWLWHKRLAHLNFKIINKLTKQNLVISLPLSTQKIDHVHHVKRENIIRPSSKQTDIFYQEILHPNHKDHLGKFDEKADDGYLLRYSLISKAFKVFNTRRQQTEETYHITFDDSPKAIKFSKPLVDNINIAESKRYPPDEYLHSYEPSQRYQTNSNDVSFIEPYECPEPVVLETKVSSNQNDQPIQNDEILNYDHSKHSNHTNDEQIIDNLPNTKDIQISEHLSSPNTEDTSAQNTAIPSPPLPVPSMVTLAPQHRWSQDKHIELVNIIDFLSEEEPKKVSKALKHPGWIDAMQDELN
ncbi:retrovirus-related pol polyprotein from transposon TNT 1-94 [Tanacetum coccineum]